MQFTITIPDDLAGLIDPCAEVAVIDAQLAPVMEARGRIVILVDGIEQAAAANNAVSQALGRLMGCAWRQPLGHEPHTLGHVVSHNGREWSNDLATNVWEPGTPNAGWTDVGKAGPPPRPDDAQPWREGNTYVVGDKVSFMGDVYSCTMAHTAHVGTGWNPVATPNMWTLIG